MSLNVENIYFSYPKSSSLILSGLSASFPSAQITAVTGPNGCGKTTLSKIMVGILKPGQGQVFLDGKDIAGFSLAEIGRYIGYVMQNPDQQLFSASVEDEVTFGLKNLDLDEKEITERIDYYLGYFQLDQYRKSLPFHLSLGEKQRVILAAILAMKPCYLVLDEPTSALDIYRRRLLGEHLLNIAPKMGCGIILISHDKSFIQKYADQQIIIRGGKADGNICIGAS